MTSTFVPNDVRVPSRLSSTWAGTTAASRAVAFGAAITSVIVGHGAAATAALRLGLAACGVIFVLAALVDVATYRIPNALMAMGLAAIGGGALIGLTMHEMLGAVIGLLIAGGSMLAVRVGRGVGMGDVKMAAVVGAGTGAVAVIAAPMAIAIAAALAAGFGLFTGRQRLPLAPSLWAGWIIALVASRLAGLA